MSNWNEGYVTDADYTYGYYKELNPCQMTIPFLMANVVFPEVKTACELGFGQGVSVNVNAATSDASWFANDFNPNHVSFANDIAQASDADITLTDESFAEFCIRDDLPDFDFIGLHGIWTWISDKNRHVIVDFISRKLKVGGVLYISYNTLPGWSAHTPIRHIMTQYEQVMGSSGQPITQRINDSLEFTKELFSHTHALNQQAPQIKERVEKLFQQNRNYLAHEYFNKDWKPMYFSEIVDWLAPAKVSYVCSPDFNADYHILNMSIEQIEFLNQTNSTVLQQTLTDFLLNRQFRKDYWVKGVRRLTKAEKRNKWRELSFLLTTPIKEVSLEVGHANLKKEMYEPLLNLLSNHQVHAFTDIEHELSTNHNMELSTIYESLAILSSKKDVEVIFAEASNNMMTQCNQLNQKLTQLNLNNVQIPYLISPLTRSVINIDYVTHLLLAARETHGDDTDACVTFAWDVLQHHNRLLMVGDKVLESEKENIDELKKRSTDLAKHSLKIYRALGLIDSENQ